MQDGLSKPDIVHNEADRLAALRALDLLDTQPEAMFDNLTSLAALIFSAPVALVTLIDAERQWFKSCIGTDICETPRDVAFCDHTIRQSRVLVVPDATLDPRFRDNPLVTGEPFIRFYAGAPLTSKDGHRLGSLCVLDVQPRAEFTTTERAQLQSMADAVSLAMNLRHDLNALRDVEDRLQAADERLRANEAQLSFVLEHSADLLLRISPDATITWISPSCARYGYAVEDLVGQRTNSLVHPDDRQKLAARRASRFASLQDPTGRNHEYRVMRKDGSWVWVEENPTIIRDADGQAIELVNLLRDISDRKRAESAAADIQMGMLLPREELAGLSAQVEVDAVLQPARMVGGDLYDAFMVDEDRLCFLLGDVTGKGLAASLFMALSKAIAHSLLRRAPGDLGAALSAISDELAQNNREVMTLSLLVGLLDLTTGRLELCNAGHDDPMVLTPDGQVADLKMEGGPPLCAALGYAYRAEVHELPRGAALVAVTDGVTEAQNAAGDLFGRAGARAVLTRHGVAGPLSGLMDSLVAAVRRFEAGEEPSDDLAAIAIAMLSETRTSSGAEGAPP